MIAPLVWGSRQSIQPIGRRRGSGDADLRSTTVVAVADPTLTVLGPAAPVRRAPIAMGSDTNVVRRLRPADAGFHGVIDMMAGACRARTRAFAKSGAPTVMAANTAVIIVVLFIVVSPRYSAAIANINHS